MPKKLAHFVYRTPLGRLTIAADGEAITRVLFGEQEAPGQLSPTALTNEAATQIQQYLAGRRRSFDLPLNPAGTPFQQSVWRALQGIPYGTTWTYAQLAEAVGNPKAFRAVGGANNRNPLPILIPCHRVVGADGSLVGYASGVHIKRFLLDLEAKALAADAAAEA
ncbi:methylated-DNA--[protein]-cysteine S-methyltransferase [Adlercreutzia aquisgranensis]|uniref:methylated-DNA--[protein]-cysteine S-methyltransferase n=1 Tax=Adlercreutzia aquisgranensis TaxID=2941323 RepID=UPI00203A54CE|nr:methylated-DNA--[protein]-cysteine S-methyltransferase [Adlercreutzia aquisgranensis]